MQFKATALMAIVAIGSSPVVAAPAPIDLALPRPSSMKEGQPIRNGLRKAGNAVTEAATVCLFGVVACMWVVGQEMKRGTCCKDDPSGKDKSVKGSTSGKNKPATPKRDVIIGDILARSPEPKADYIHVVTRDTTEEEAAEETAEETADEEADEEADE